ncbi:MAG: putative porin [Porticoccaceae bacterium]|jgi:predicted porin|nr:porin [Porticoccaceae bacterium]|tara:strand:- start:432 stop:1391 length:960 start_codon:yes stop_codon:yes gene_type:complete
MMKGILLILALCFTSFSFAEGPIGGKVYGKANLSLVDQDSGDTSGWNLNSNASRLGIKGESKISEELAVVYQVEYEVCIDSGDCKGQTFKQRNTFLGLKGNFGMVSAGKHDTPTKLAAKKVDLFNDLEGDIKNAFEGENRVSNVVAYTSPKMNGFSATLAMIPAEGEDVDQDGQDDTGLKDGLSYSINYTKDNLYLAIAGDQDIDEQDLVRMIAQYQIDALTLGFLYQQNQDNLGAKDESGYFFSAAYSLNPDITLKAQYGEIEDDIDGDKEQTLSLGADYKLSKNTKTFIFYTDNTDSEVGLSEDAFTAFGIGMEHKF